MTIKCNRLLVSTHVDNALALEHAGVIRLGLVEMGNSISEYFLQYSSTDLSAFGLQFKDTACLGYWK